MNRGKLFSLWLVLGVIDQVWPHPPDASPLLALAVLAWSYLGGLLASLALLLISLLANSVLSYFHHYPVIGWWMALTLPGLFGVMLLGRWLRPGIFAGAAAALLYWLWTNAGVWWWSGYYAHSWSGLWQCYLLAWPFLGRSLLATVAWAWLITSGSQLSTLAYKNRLFDNLLS